MAIEISLSGIPPYKQTPANNERERQVQNERREALKKKAREICDSPSNDNLSLNITYWRHRGRADSANIIGGIADALQGVAYKNDRQIKTIHYCEKEGKGDQYTISISVEEK